MTYGLVLLLSGIATRRLVDFFVSPEASQITDKTFEKKMKVNSKYVSEGIYKNQDEIEREYDLLKYVTFQQVSNPLFFHNGKCFFI